MTNTAIAPRPVDTRPEEERAQEALEVVMRLRGLSNAELARLIDISTTGVRDLRTGRTLIKIGTLHKLAEKCAVPQELFQWKEPQILRWWADQLEAGTLPSIGTKIVRRHLALVDAA